MENVGNAPTPEEIRNWRGSRSRAEFARLLGVTPLTVYRWELPLDSPELRRPRGKVLQRLQAWIASQSNGGRVEPNRPRSEVKASELAPAESAALAPILHAVDQCQLEHAESQLVELLTSETLQSEASRALASIMLARLQLLSRLDTRAAFTTLIAIGTDVSRFPSPVQFQYHFTVALLHAQPDPRLFNPGKSHHHLALAEALPEASEGNHRFELWLVQSTVAAALFDAALLGRAMERFASVRDLATTPLNRAMVTESAAIGTLSLTNLPEAAARVAELQTLASTLPLPLQQLRALIWRAEVGAEESAPPEQLLALLDQAEQQHRRHRIAWGVHSMLMNRNRGEALMRLGRLAEAEAAFFEAERIGRELNYTPIRIYTALARLHHYGARVEETRALAEKAVRSEDAQRELTRACGRVMLLLCEVETGAAGSGWFDELSSQLTELRRLGVWPVAYRHLVMHALAVTSRLGAIEQAERILRVAERAVEGSPSPTASALFRRYQGTVLLRRGRFTEARQLLEATHASFEVAGNAPEAALVRRVLANLDVLTGEPDAERRMTEAEENLVRLGMAVPAVLSAKEARVPRETSSHRADLESLQLSSLVVPLQRLSLRGVGAPILQKELVNIASELFPARAVRLEEVDSNGASLLLGAREDTRNSSLEWFDFSDGVGRRLRLGVSGKLDDSNRAALRILTSGAALAFEVAALRGFSASSNKPASTEAEAESVGLPDFVAASDALRRLKSELKRLSGSRATIIVTGESGTGKEVVARAIHDLSQRAARPYVTFNSAAVPRELFEGQLFGYKKGAFTGATADHPGVIRAAEGGTLFLDEIGELPLEIQPKLLRFLENGEVFPLGMQKPVQVDVRVIAATHRDLLQLVRERKFREDLYYRLQVIPVHIPPLRERREDVVGLARHFIRKLTPAGKEPPVLSPDGELKLMAHTWPGNVRELRNVMERSLAFEPLPALLTADLIRL